MRLEHPFRRATANDARFIAELVAESSGGVAPYSWSRKAPAGTDLLAYATTRYANPEENFSYRNCVVAEPDKNVVGMLLTFAIPPRAEEDGPPARPTADCDDVLAPYAYLEAPGTWYVCGVAVVPAWRGKGLGSRLMEIAAIQARDRGFRQVSLIAFEENEGSVRLYQRLGYRVTDRAPVVAHPLIRYRGDALLMVAEI